MAYFNRDNQSGGNRSFGKPRFNNDRPEMHKATCDSCGNACEVPFRPTGSKPVLCRDCFRNNPQNDRRSDDRGAGRPSEDRQMFDATCSKCGDKCQIPFRPSPGREVFCSRCFDMSKGEDTRRPERKSFDRPSFNRDENRAPRTDMPNYKAQFEALNAKMDKIINMLQPAHVEAAPLESEISEDVIDAASDAVLSKKVEATSDVADIKEKKPRKAKAAVKKTTKKKAAPKKK